MLRWLFIAVIAFFIVGQLTRLRPSKRDQQLQALRATAAQAGLVVRFWTSRNSGYQHRQLPTSGFLYSLPWLSHGDTPQHWAVWVSEAGDMVTLAGNPPSLAQEWLTSFRQRFPDGWALLECTQTGLGVLWQERGNADDVRSLASALGLLRKSLV